MLQSHSAVKVEIKTALSELKGNYYELKSLNEICEFAAND